MNIIQKQKELKRIARIADQQLRNVLISTAENVEKMLKDGKITMSTPLRSILPHGLSVEVKAASKGDDKPMIFTFIYKMDLLQMKQWLLENPNLCEGPLSFVSRGIEVVVPYGPNKIEKVSFSIDNSDGERIWLRLENKPITFHVHRNLFGGKEWECFYDEE